MVNRLRRSNFSNINKKVKSKIHKNFKMKLLVIFAVVLFAVSCQYSLWHNWHNDPVPWVPNPSYLQPLTNHSVTGFTRNGPTNQHFSGKFNNYTKIFTQYLWWKTSNPQIVIMCRPKYYLYNETLCKVDPYFKTGYMTTYCQPNYYNHPYMPSKCEPSQPLMAGIPCCYDGVGFEKTITSEDPYEVPIW